MLPSLLFLVFHGLPVVQPTTAACQDVQRIELSLARGVTEEICVSSGLLTGFVFDSPVVVDLEDEIRFAEVTHGRSSFSFMPPGDGVVGERFRLTARFVDGASVTFVLIAHRGRATRQVEVYRDKRTRESYEHEVAQEQAKVQQLQQENESLQRQLEQTRAECGDPRGLRRLIASRSMGKAGIHAQEFKQELIGHTESHLSVMRGVTYRSDDRVVVEVWLLNSSSEPWEARSAKFVDAKGEEMGGIQLWQEGGPIPPHESRMVVVEADAPPGAPQGEVTLSLRDAGPRGITIPKVTFP